MDTYPIVPPLPEFERKTDLASTDRGGATTDKALSPEQLASQASQDALLTDSIHQTADARDVADRKAALEAQHAKEMADEAGRQAQLDAVATAKSQEAIAAAKQRLTSKQAEYDKAPSPSFFHHGDTWGNALRGMALGLGTLGDSMQKAAMVRIGQAPPNIDTVGDIIGADLQKQEHHIARLKDNVVMAHTGLADANEARAQMIADRHQAAATAYDRLIKLAAARMASLGYDNNRIAQSDEIIKLREKREAEKAQAVAPLTKTVEGHWLHKGQQVSETNRQSASAAKGPTESQAKLADLSAGLTSELDTIKKLPPLTQEELAKVQDNQQSSNAADNSTGLIGSTVSRAGRAVGAIPRTKYEGLTPEAQRSMNAWDAAVELRARQLTGAGMPETEAIREARTLGYSPGDSPDVMRQKIQRLEDSAKRGVQLSGQGGAIVAPGIASHQTAPGQAPTHPPPLVPAPPPPAPPAGSNRDKAIQLIKSHPNGGANAVLMRKYGITPEELR